MYMILGTKGWQTTSFWMLADLCSSAGYEGHIGTHFRPDFQTAERGRFLVNLQQ